MVDEQRYSSCLADAGEKIVRSGNNRSFRNSAEEFLDENLRYSDYGESYDAVLGAEEDVEFRLDNITQEPFPYHSEFTKLESRSKSLNLPDV